MESTTVTEDVGGTQRGFDSTGKCILLVNGITDANLCNFINIVVVLLYLILSIYIVAVIGGVAAAVVVICGIIALLGLVFCCHKVLCTPQIGPDHVEDGCEILHTCEPKQS